MKTSHKIVLPLAAVALIIAGAASTVALQTHAQTTSSPNNHVSSLVNAIAKKFNLNTSDVQQVFDDQRALSEAQRQQDFTDRINQAAKDGKLTQDQADKIIAKAKEMQSKIEGMKDNFSNMTEQQRRDAMKNQMDALQKWATDNSIPTEYLMFGFKGPHGGPGHGQRPF